MSEDEYLEISDIKRDQSGEYECSALNDVAAPDVRKVKITVNCELICSQGTPEGKGRGLNQQSRSDSALFSKPPHSRACQQEGQCFIRLLCSSTPALSFIAGVFPGLSELSASQDHG